MSARAPVEPVDGIVVVELSLDVTHEVENIVAFIRSGAAALEAAPVPRTAAAEMVSRQRAVEHGRAVAQEIEDEYRRVHAAREAAYKQANRPTRGRR